MAQVAYREHPLFGRRLRGRADIPEDARSAAVPDILKLNDDAVGIAEIELGGSSRRAARFRAAHPDARSHRAAAQAAAGAFGTRDATARQNGHDAVGVEVLDAHAEMVDARRAVGARATHGEKLRSRANPQQRRLSLPR